MATQILDLTCPKCGGTMEQHPEQHELVCPFCGHKVVLEQPEDTQKIAEKAYARQAGILKANEEADRRKMRRKRGRTVLIVLVVIAAIALLGAIGNFARPAVDPFAYITVAFSGVTGDGTAKIVRTDTAKAKGIRYTLEQEYDLSEGDTVKVTAQSDEYRLTPSSKTYKVEGLDLYLTDLDALSDKAVEMIHNKSDNTVRSAATGVASHAVIVSLEPCIMYLVTDGGSYNTLYDVYKVTYQDKDEQISERYVMAYYTQIVVRDTEEPTMQYRSTMYEGYVIEALDHSYGGYITGYQSLKDAKADILSEQEREITLKERSS